jgi:uncharacterized protein (TIGR00730 family)
MTVCIFAASSSRTDGEFSRAASLLGSLLAMKHIDIVYGGGGIGLMGKLADAALEKGGKVKGVIPVFMKEEGWGHQGISEMIVTEDMSERKKKMFAMSDAVVALPGGIGTVEEITEAITLKQLGLFHGRIVILNTQGYYDLFLRFIDHMIEGNFMRSDHRRIWEVARTPEEVITILSREGNDNEEWRKIAKI